MSAPPRDFAHGDELRRVSLRALAAGRYAVHVGDAAYEVEAALLPDGRVRCAMGGDVFEADCAPCGKALQVRLRGRTWTLVPARRGRAAQAGDGAALAPMTGTVLDVRVAVGDEVAVGQPLVVLSAMKMEHKLTAGIAGVVVEVRARKGEAVEQGALLVRLEATPGTTADKR